MGKNGENPMIPSLNPVFCSELYSQINKVVQEKNRLQNRGIGGIVQDIIINGINWIRKNAG